MSDTTGAAAGVAPVERIEWMRQGTDLFAGRLAALTDAELDAPTSLSDWTRRHVAAHVAANARALRRLVSWARTGVRNPMYTDMRSRDAEIERDAALPPAEIRRAVAESADALHAELDALPADRWSAEVVTAQGRSIPAAEIPWMRCREVWVHAVDLDNGASFHDFPAPLVDALAADVFAAWRRREQRAAFRPRATDRAAEWPAGVDAAGEEAGSEVVVTGPAADLAAWLTGRGGHGLRALPDGTPLPEPPPWL